MAGENMFSDVWVLGRVNGRWEHSVWGSQDKIVYKIFKRGNIMQKKIFFVFFFKKKNYFSIFLTFGFWGGSMAGENVQFEEGRDKFV